MGNFANIYDEERTKEQYVDDKIQLLDDFLIFSKRPLLDKRTIESRKSLVKKNINDSRSRHPNRRFVSHAYGQRCAR